MTHPTTEYWERRYRAGKRGSGPGSRGLEAQQKAAYINRLIVRHHVNRVIDWGCGDGIVASLIASRRYIGLEVSERALAMCRERVLLPRRHWVHFDGIRAPKLPPADMALSLDVIFHLTDDKLYRAHLRQLFRSAPLVVVHSSDWDEPGESHVLHRQFTKDVPKGWRCVAKPEVEHAIGFYVFEKVAP